MMRSIRTKKPDFSHNPAARGYHAVYHEQEKNFCPGCGGTHWWRGRFSAECVHCGTALPLTDALYLGNPVHMRRGATGGWAESE